MAEVIVALDLDSAADVERLVDRIPGLGWAKVGATLFAREGQSVVKLLQHRKIRVFLDLKWHDIPHQVIGLKGQRTLKRPKIDPSQLIFANILFLLRISSLYFVFREQMNEE